MGSSVFDPVFYLFVGLCVYDAHTLYSQAGVSQRTRVTSEPRGGVHTIHSREAGVKLALQERRKERGHEDCLKKKKSAKCVSLSGLLTEKSF